MTVDPTVIPGLLLLAAELLALGGVGFVVARVVLRQTDDRLALAQGLVIGPAAWGLLANALLHPFPGRAGALAAWLIILTLAAALVWRARPAPSVTRRTFVGFVLIFLAVFLIALAARQSLITSDAYLRFGLGASIQAGVWPPALPWNPWQPIPYHYGASLLAALLAPPEGPNLAFLTEVLDAYAWSSLMLLVGALLLQRGGWLGGLIFAPLLLSAGAWTQLNVASPALIQFPAPTGPPEPGVRAALAGLYWPTPEWPWPYPEPHAVPANIWFLRFTLAYGLALTVLERLTAGPRPPAWPAALTVAALIGFVGLIEEAVALTVLGLWGLLEAIRILRARPDWAEAFTAIRRAAAGPLVATLLVVSGGGVITGMLTTGETSSDLVFGWIDNPGRRPPGFLEQRPGGLALLGLGPALVAPFAVLLAWRQRLVLALVGGSGVFLAVALLLRYEIVPHNIARLDGHAGVFALLALVTAAAPRLPALPYRWRYFAGALIVLLVVWPTIAMPIRTLAVQLGRGLALANAQPHPADRDPALYAGGVGRHVMESLTPDRAAHYLPVPLPPLHVQPTGALAPDRVIRYIRHQTPPDARIFSPHPRELTLATGRPNAAGLAGHLHYVWHTGAEYRDALSYLEPAALRRLGFAFVHATDAWVASLPDRARRWLNDPDLFDLVVREGAHALYRVQPAFQRLAPQPHPQSFEALRQAVPASALVYLGEIPHLLDRIPIASVLAHARLAGNVDQSMIHLTSDLPTEPLGDRTPDVVIMPRERPMDVISNQPVSTIWGNHVLVAYAISPTIAPPAAAPPPPVINFTVRLSHVRLAHDRIRFAATFSNRAPERWTGQDWLVIQMTDGPWILPTRYEADGYTNIGARWFVGQSTPGSNGATHTYEFDPLMGTLATQGADGHFVSLPSAGDRLAPGVYVLAARLRQHYLQAAVIPVLKFVIAQSGDVVYTTYAGERGADVNACPESLQHTDACRELTAVGAVP
ncbi:MAG: hypothetical protein OXG65_12035 [Chloroflexi bacterium]|nr:hypothetical protein [Chloroflexota bacterium]